LPYEDEPQSSKAEQDQKEIDAKHNSDDEMDEVRQPCSVEKKRIVRIVNLEAERQENKAAWSQP
jgi:hypothetical protein